MGYHSFSKIAFKPFAFKLGILSSIQYRSIHPQLTISIYPQDKLAFSTFRFEHNKDENYGPATEICRPFLFIDRKGFSSKKNY